MNAPASRIAPPFPTNPAVGERHGSWVWNGVTWVCAPTTGIQVLTTVFTASGPYMPSPGLVSVTVECIGGGGAGGGVGDPANNIAGGGSGGGSGGYSSKTLPAALVLGGVQVTIGAGGAFGGNAGQADNGQATTFGALCVANGGSGGFAMFPGVTAPEPGAGAAPGVGDVALPGAAGTAGYWELFDAAQTNFSSATPLGGQIRGGNANLMTGAGNGANGPPAAPNTGAGGAGATANQLATPTSFSGGGGGSGLVIVTEYCWATGDSGEDCMNPPVNVNARVAVTHVPWPGPGPCPPGWGQGPYDYEGDG